MHTPHCAHATLHTPPLHTHHSAHATLRVTSLHCTVVKARLAANEAKERRALTKTDESLASNICDSSGAEAEAADVRRMEFSSLAQSKMGKQAQIEELTERVGKEGGTSEMLRGKLEGALVDEQDVLKEWGKLDEELQEAEVEKASLVTAKQREKEVALEKAQLAEAGLEELKEAYRAKRREEEKSLKYVSDAEVEGQEAAWRLDEQLEQLRSRKGMWIDQLRAAEVWTQPPRRSR